jgi:16S rRNA (cytidine1402-2'-O)-methyltransferase
VSTPIGNLEDITIRALKILNEATLILCEDTRKTRQLLTLLGVQSSSSSKGKQKKLLAYHSHNFYEQRETLRDRIVRNEDEEVIALVSDAGAPVVSDPGQDLVDLVLEATKANGGGGGGERKSVVVPIPGASAVTTAVIGSGFKCDDGYRFCGFLPAKKNERVKVLESLTSETSLLVFFVSPHKLVKTLEDVAAVYSKSPPRRVCVARELTKRHEEFFRGTCEECLEEFSKEGRARGEITLLVESSDFCASTKKTTATKVAPKDINDDDDTNDDDESDKNTAKVLLEKTLRHLLLERAENQRLSVSEAARKVSQDLGVKRRVAYSLAQKIKDSSSGNTNSE